MEEWTKDDIMERINGDKTAVLYFYTPLCGTCQVAGKMLSIAEQIVKGVEFGKADLNYMPEMAERFSIESVPCLIVLDKGQEAEKIYAFQSVPHLHEVIKKYS